MAKTIATERFHGMEPESRALSATAADEPWAGCIAQRTAFRPAWWLPGGHAQTIYPAVAETPPALTLGRERLTLPDGDFLDLFHGPQGSGRRILLLHGLSGSARSAYILRAALALATAGYRITAMQYRGAGDEPNNLDRFYHSGAIDDVAHVVDTLRERDGGQQPGLVGFSLGGILTLNYLGEYGTHAGCRAAIAISAPLDLAASARAVNQGLARIYQWDILRGLKRMLQRKFAGRSDPPVSPGALRRIRTLRDFDEHVTAPLHGFHNAADYYRRWSPGRRLDGVRRPCLVLCARDDPFVPAAARHPDTMPTTDLRMELADGGGHVGFVCGGRPGAAQHWLPERIVSFMQDTSPACGPPAG